MENVTQLHQGSLNGLRRQTNECLEAAYNKGYQDGKLDFEESDGQAEYNNGYKTGIADYRKFEKFFKSEGVEVFEDIRNTDGTLSIDMILQYLPMREIMARIKAYEEKKKSEEEIKVGDEVKDFATGNIGVVMSIGKRIISYITNKGVYSSTLHSLEKTGRHFNEVEQLLSKLKIESEE